ARRRSRGWSGPPWWGGVTGAGGAGLPCSPICPPGGPLGAATSSGPWGLCGGLRPPTPTPTWPQSGGAKWPPPGGDLLPGPATGPRVAALLACAIDVTTMTACPNSATVTAGGSTDLQYSRADS